MFEYLKIIKNYFENTEFFPVEEPVIVFAILLFLILFIPLLFKKIKIPGIIGLIIVGIIIGDYGFNIIQNNAAINLFSAIGMLYIMFLAGLELDLSAFKINKYKSIIFGLFTFSIPIAIGFPICYYVLNLDIALSCLISVMFATHTLIAYPIVSRLGISKDTSIAVAVGGTILTDTAVFILLTVIFEMKGFAVAGSMKLWLLKFFIGISVFSVIMFVIVPKLSKWFFRKLENEKYSHYIYVLFILFGASFLAKKLGLEEIIGAFSAGLILNRFIPHTSQLMNRICFIGNALFIPIFLVSVGMIINPQQIIKGYETITLTIILTTVAILGKWLAAFFSQKILKFTKIQRNIIFGLSSSHVAATLVVMLTGKEQGIVNDTILNGTIFLILITCIIASFVTERAGLKMVLDEEKNDNQNRKIVFTKNEYILIPVGNYKTIERILNFTNIIINKTLTHKILLLSVVKTTESDDTNIKKRKEKLLKESEKYSIVDTKIESEIAIDSNVAGGIVRASKEKDTDIIVLDWERKNTFTEKISDKFLGSTIDNIIINSQLSLFICDFKYPLATHKSIILVALPLAETEIGFLLWNQKVAMLANELSKTMIYYCNEKTEIAVRQLLEQKKIKIKINFVHTKNWDSINDINLKLTKDDLIIFVSIRQGAISYKGILESLPSRITKIYPDNSKIIIYPEERREYHEIDIFNDITSSPLKRSLENIEKITKKLKRKKI